MYFCDRGIHSVLIYNFKVFFYVSIDRCISVAKGAISASTDMAVGGRINL